MDARVAVAAGIAGLAVIGCGASTSPMSASQPPATASVGAGPVARALQQTWRSYAHSFIRDGRVVDPRNDYNTTSEGQSYALLRAVWMDDRSTFDAVWTWTRDHLWVDAEQRFGWSWVASAAQLVSQDSATDADQDIALALVFAAHRWSGGYMDWARRVLTGIWRNEVTTVGGTPYVTAGNWAASNSPGPVLNPSYFAPYAYRIFAAVDSAHPWLSLVGSSYAALNACSQAQLGSSHSVGLPPNWCILETSTGKALSYPGKSDGDEFGYDAFRVMWRTALDERWFGSAAARAYLAGQQFLRQEWQQRAAFSPVYGHDGTPRASYDDVTVYGGDAGAFIDSPADAAALERHLMASFAQTGTESYWGESDNYYAQNWVWFGLALLDGVAMNLAGGQ